MEPSRNYVVDQPSFWYHYFVGNYCSATSMMIKNDFTFRVVFRHSAVFWQVNRRLPVTVDISLYYLTRLFVWAVARLWGSPRDQRLSDGWIEIRVTVSSDVAEWPLLVWSYSKARPHFSCNSWNQRAAVIFSWNLVPKCRYETSLTLLLSQITTKKIVVKHSANVILVLALFSIRLEKAHCPLPKQNKVFTIEQKLRPSDWILFARAYFCLLCMF